LWMQKWTFRFYKILVIPCPLEDLLAFQDRPPSPWTSVVPVKRRLYERHSSERSVIINGPVNTYQSLTALNLSVWFWRYRHYDIPSYTILHATTLESST
jgi:hypothetical protein